MMQFDMAEVIEDIEDFVDIPALEQLPDVVAAAAADHWRNAVMGLASLHLNSTAATYIGQIGPIEVEDGTASIMFPLEPDHADGKLADRLENGGPSIDLKDSMLAGLPWRDVPLGRDDNTSAAISRKQGVAREFDPRTVGRRLQAATKRLKVGEVLDLPDVAMSDHESRLLQERYAGLRRLDRRDAMTKALIGAKYATFRRMSENSEGWVVPPMQGHFFFEQAKEVLDPFLNQFVEDLLNGMAMSSAKSNLTRRVRRAT